MMKTFQLATCLAVLSVGLGLASGAFAGEDADGRFVRGDASSDGRVNITDVVLTLRIVLGGVPARYDCEDALDSNDDGRTDVSDLVPILQYLFQRGPELPAPFLECGVDSTDDDLTCDESSGACA